MDGRLDNRMAGWQDGRKAGWVIFLDGLMVASPWEGSFWPNLLTSGACINSIEFANVVVAH